jgi:hypothetical protein
MGRHTNMNNDAAILTVRLLDWGVASINIRVTFPTRIALYAREKSDRQ